MGIVINAVSNIDSVIPKIETIKPKEIFKKMCIITDPPVVTAA